MAGKTLTERIQLDILVNGDKAQKEYHDIIQMQDALKENIGKYETALNKVEKAEESAMSKLKKMKEEGKENTEEFKKLVDVHKKYHDEAKRLTDTLTKQRNAVDANEKQLISLRKTIGLTKLTVAQLREEQKLLKQTLAGVIPGTPQWKKYEAELKAVEAQLKKLGATAKVTQVEFAGIANKFNKYAGIAATIIATVTGLRMKFRQLAQDVAKMDDAYSEVMKTTGMSRQEVKELNEEFKKIDTRTAREELNKFAVDAGKLGIEGKENILEFVKAADKIKMVVGQDMGDDAIKTIAKMVNILTDSTKQLQGVGLEEQMLKVGSAILQVGQSSTASEPYLVEFSGRMAGVAAQAGLSMDAILGFASSLDQDMQKVEMSATALQKFIMKLMTDPAKFAKIAGMEVKKFNELLKKDTNEAILTVLEALKKKGGLQQLAPMFKEMGVDGVRATSVLGALSNHIDQVREAQQVANKALESGNMITEVFNQKNNNLQARLEKARNAYVEAGRALGERLNPALLKSTNIMTYIIKALPKVIDFFAKYGKVILTIVAAITAYNIALWLTIERETKLGMVSRLNLVWKKLTLALTNATTGATYALAAAKHLLAGRTDEATASWKKMNNAMKSNLLGMVLAVIIALGVAISSIVKSAREATKHLREFNAELEIEKRKANELFEALKRTNAGTQERSEILKSIQENYGEYLKHLKFEKGGLEDIEKAQAAVNRALERNIALKYQNQKIEDIVRKAQDKIQRHLHQIRLAFSEKIIDKNLVEQELRKYYQAIKDNDEQVQEEILRRYNLLLDKSASVTSTLFSHERTIMIETHNISSELKKMNDEIEKTNTLYSPFITEDPQKQLTDLEKLYEKKKKLEASMNSTDIPDEKKDLASDLRDINAQIKTMEANLKKLEIKNQLIERYKELQGILQKILMTNEEKDTFAKESDDIKTRLKNEFGIDVDYAPTEKGGGGDDYTPSSDDKKSNLSKEKIKALENRLAEELNALRQYRNEGIITEKEYNDAVDQLTLESYKRKLQIKELERDQWLTIEQQRLDLELKMQKECDKELLDELQKKRDKNLQNLDKQKNDELEALQETTEDQKLYAILAKEVELKYANERLQVLKDYGDDVANAEFAIKESQVKAIEENGQKVIDADAAIIEARTKMYNEYAKTQREFDRLFKPKDFNSRKQAEKTTLEAFKERKDEKGNPLISEEAYQKALADIDKKYADERYRTRQQLGIASLYEQFEQEKEIIQQAYDDGLMKEGEYQMALFQLRCEYVQKYVDFYAQAMSGLVDALKQGESDQLDETQRKERKAIEDSYNRKIKGAKKGSKAQKKLEEEKAAALEELDKKQAKEKAELNKKYADSEFATKLAQLIASTAVAIMQAFSQLGPIGGAIAGALISATATVQAINLNKERQRVKALPTEFYTGGFTEKGDKYEPAGVVHKGEFVATQEAVKNPTVRPILDLIDSAQRSGTIKQIDLSSMFHAPTLTQRRFDNGGYTSTTTAPPAPLGVASTLRPEQPSKTDLMLIAAINQLNENLTSGISATVVANDDYVRTHRRASKNFETKRKQLNP
jgi:TP901 family phage tail tape measure protein